MRFSAVVVVHALKSAVRCTALNAAFTVGGVLVKVVLKRRSRIGMQLSGGNCPATSPAALHAAFTSVCVSAEISVRTPKKLFIFIIKKLYFLGSECTKTIVSILKTEAMVFTIQVHFANTTLHAYINRLRGSEKQNIPVGLELIQVDEM